MSLRSIAHAVACWLAGDRVVYRTTSMFGPVRIVERDWEGDRVRVLEVAGTYQSATYLDDRWCVPPFAYLRALSCVFEGDHPVRDVLLLGGGAFAFPKHALACHPEARVVVAEVDPTIIALAHSHFFLDRLEREHGCESSGRLQIRCEDALVCLTRASEEHRSFDAIINDVYQAEETPDALANVRSARLVAGLLAPHGLYVTNIVTSLSGEDAWKLAGLVETLGHAFAHVAALPLGAAPDESSNRLVIAANTEIRLPDAVPLLG